MRTLLFIPPHLSWFESLIRDIRPQIDICGDISELPKFPNHYKIVADNLVGTQSDLDQRVLNYLPIFDKIVITNSEVPINILDQCVKFDHEKIELCITGKVNYTPKHMKIFRHENFFSCVQMLYQRLNIEPLKELTPYKPKPYYFDALLGLEKPGRTFIYTNIQEQFPDKVFTRYHQTGENLGSLKDDHFRWPSGVEVLHTPGATSNTIRYLGQETWISHVVPVDIYNQSAYSIISETYDDNTFSFFTEKTTKALIAKRLFVMFAGAYYLQNLRELGFKTFSNVIDESYDLEEDHNKRHQMAFDQVSYLCNQDQTAILEATKPTLEHNYNLLMSQDWHQYYLDLIQSRILPQS